MAYIIESKPQTKIYDSLFIAIFGRNTKQSKQWRLDLYNALNNTNYTDPDALEVNTIENVIFINMYNDVSFLIDSQMTLYEQQSTTNANMPLRGLMYFSQLYQQYINDIDEELTDSVLIKIPNPNFVVFYNGQTNRPDDYELKLSDAFINEDKSGRFEWTARVININADHNEILQKKCKVLYDYSRFITRIRSNKKSGLPLNKAVDEAVEWACKENLLDGYIRSKKMEVRGMLLTEFDEERFKRVVHRHGVQQGREEKAVEAATELLKENISPETIAKCVKLPLEKVLELQRKFVPQV